jgi:hypothetical protein
VFNGPEIPMSILFLSMAAIFVLRGPLGKAERMLARQDERALPQPGREAPRAR